MTGDSRPTRKRQHRLDPDKGPWVDCWWSDDEETCAYWPHRDAPPDAPAPLSHDAGEAVKRIIDSMEPPDAQPETVEEIVLHRWMFVGDPDGEVGDWTVCHYPNQCDDRTPTESVAGREHAVAVIRRKRRSQ